MNLTGIMQAFLYKVWLEKKDEQQLVRGVKHFFVLFLGKIPYLSSLLLSFSFIKRHSTVIRQIPWIALILYSRCYSTFLTMSDWKPPVFCVYRSRKGFPGISGTHSRLDLTEQVVAKSLSAKKWVFTLCIAYMKRCFLVFPHSGKLPWRAVSGLSKSRNRSYVNHVLFSGLTASTNSQQWLLLRFLSFAGSKLFFFYAFSDKEGF